MFTCPVCSKEHATPDIVEFVTSPCYLGPDTDISPAQVAVLKAIYGLQMTAEELEVFLAMTEGRKPRPGGYSEVWLIVGRRSGKTDKVLANIAAYEIFVFDASRLADGEKAYFPIIAQDLEGASRARAYVEGKLQKLEDKKWAILEQGGAQSRAITGKEIRTKTGVTVKCFPASKAAVRGLTAIGYGTDESAFWETKDGAYNPDKEVFRALRPTTVSMGRQAKKISVTSPYAEEGEAWSAYNSRATSRALVIHAPSWIFHPKIDREALDELEFTDPTAYLREYGAQFGKESGTFLSPDEVERAIDKSRPLTIPREVGNEYVGAIDVGFKHDLYALAVGHLDSGIVVFDCVRWWKGTKKVPLDGAEVARDASEIFKAYGIDRIKADQYSDLSVKKDYGDSGITVDTENATEALNFEEAKNMKSSIRLGRVNLPDDPMIRRDFLSVRRVGGGRYPRIAAPEKMGFHDDIFRACCKVLMDLLPISGGVDLWDVNQRALPGGGIAHPEIRRERNEEQEFHGNIMSEVY